MPDIRSPEEAAAYVTKLRQILRYLGTCDGNMQNGNMRADVNVSVCPAGQYEKFRASGDFSHLGTRCEKLSLSSSVRPLPTLSEKNLPSSSPSTLNAPSLPSCLPVPS